MNLLDFDDKCSYIICKYNVSTISPTGKRREISEETRNEQISYYKCANR
jgi:hypothetical protein